MFEFDVVLAGLRRDDVMWYVAWNVILIILFALLQLEFNSQNLPKIQRRSPLLCHDQSLLLVRPK